MRGPTAGERVEGDLSCGVLRLTERGAVVRTLEDLAIEVDSGLEARRVVRTFPEARVRREVEAAPLRQLLKLVLVHLARSPPSHTSSLSNTLRQGGSTSSNARAHRIGGHGGRSQAF